MFCENCGSEIKDGDAFCTNCGHRIVQALSEQEDKTMSVMTGENASQGGSIDLKVKKKSKLPIILVLTTVALAAVVIFVLVVAGNNSTSSKVKKQLQLAQRYLEELNYEQAVAAYEKAIEIDPMCTDAYLGLADIYEQNGEYDLAIEILKKGIEVTGDETLRERLDQVERIIADQEIANRETDQQITEETNSEAEEETLPEETVKTDGFINDEGYYVFGVYEQDGDETNGPEPIEWEILGENENGVLLVSRYVLDCVPYNTELAEVTWETCSLRRWMNNEFYNSAFDETMKAKINTVTLTNEDNRRFGTEGGNDTTDKVFCLSEAEIEKYYEFNSWYTEDNPYYAKNDNYPYYEYGYCERLIIPPTAYAKQRGVNILIISESYYYDGTDYLYGLVHENYSPSVIGQTGATWGLRSPGNQDLVLAVISDGQAGAGLSGGMVNGGGRGLRPALYVNEITTSSGDAGGSVTIHGSTEAIGIGR